MQNEDTICAIATPPGEGAIAIIRLSGKNAIPVCDKLYQSPKKGKKLIDQAPNTVHYGSIVERETTIDEVVATIFKEPHSYTGENTVEIACHGSLFVQQSLLQAFIRAGARQAQAGEFTMRAFLNGKLDLSQAEAVADLIASKTKAAHRTALQQMRGGITSELQSLRSSLLEFASLLELELDFAEEDVEFADRKQLTMLIQKIAQHTKRLLKSFDVGNAIKNGIPVAIVGQPNAGKSTLLNALLNEDRAIVSEIPGTTRDTIEDSIVIDGIAFRFIDTAGLRHTGDAIENLGIARTHKTIENAEIVILVTEPEAQGMQLMQTIESILDKQKKLIVAMNKIDIQETILHDAFKNHFKTVFISAKKRQNMDELLQTLVELSGYKLYEQDDVIVTNTRHYEALNKTNHAIERITNGLQNNLSNEFIAQDIREALHYLGEITGQISNDEILGTIFSKFCIGK